MDQNPTLSKLRGTIIGITTRLAGVHNAAIKVAAVAELLEQVVIDLPGTNSMKKVLGENPGIDPEDAEICLLYFHIGMVNALLDITLWLDKSLTEEYQWATEEEARRLRPRVGDPDYKYDSPERFNPAPATEGDAV